MASTKPAVPPADPPCWMSSDSSGGSLLATADCLCLGTGRFLRAVLVPAMLQYSSPGVAFVQTRSTTFMEFMRKSNDDKWAGKYPVDTVLDNGDVHTDYFACSAAFSLGTVNGKRAFYDNLSSMRSVSMIGVGVTEAGLASADTPAMKDLMELLQRVHELMDAKQLEEPRTPNRRICIINTDNMPENGNVLFNHMITLAARSKDPAAMADFLQQRVVFYNTMVDRITSHRPNAPMIPRAEPIPDKALVILDEHGDLPNVFYQLQTLGVVVRTKPQQLQADIALKLRIANGTHTAISHLLALLKQPMTTCLSVDSTAARMWMMYLDELFASQILPATVASLSIDKSECQAVYSDWRRRLLHPHFGLSTFFVTQNGAAKGGIRLSPTVRDLVENNLPVTVAMALAFAALLRWLTPRSNESPAHEGGIFTGWLAASADDATHPGLVDREAVEYADKMRYNLCEHWYEFKCACQVQDGKSTRNLSEWLGGFDRPQVAAVYFDVLQAYLVAPDGGNLGDLASMPAFASLVRAIAVLYGRMVAEHDLMSILKEICDASGIYGQGMATDCCVFAVD